MGWTGNDLTEGRRQPRRTVTTLAVGDVYLRLAVGMIESVRRVAGSRYRYTICYCLANPAPFADRYDIEFIDVSDAANAMQALDEVYQNSYLARAYKALPLVHPSLRTDLVLFLDADCWAFDDCFADIFHRIQRHHVLLFGHVRPDDHCQISIGDFRLNLKDEARRMGHDIRNVALNSGLIGRTPDEPGLAFASLVRQLMKSWALPPFPGRYFNDEPYFGLAFELNRLAYGIGELSGLPGLYCTTHAARLTDTGSGHPDVVKLQSGQGAIHKPAIVHFVGFRQFPFYLDLVEGAIPEGAALRSWPASSRFWRRVVSLGTRRRRAT